MRLWRISDYLDLSGEGGVRIEGRWHSAGRPIVYAAESSALAMLEVLVRYGRRQLPPPFQLLEIEVPESVSVAEFGEALPKHIEDSRKWGDRWLAEGEMPLAKVPSAIAPKCFNFLVNPVHLVEIKLVAHAHYPWDSRLFR